ncbi:tetratricopeptide repeat protein [Desulfuromonas sp. AOP6]|uniref:tetratricopeptide repeat protein n=1 Tax=Desulfuromonas sp. AOP6 TaxID=1566351 RepID=UPI0012825D67|nr:tetratricopeptide repeat protein [Desulfuromonas sp. AOP6]BCA80194.1 hypothetical protein AOP6_1981 [Desulfuromonas sp. AOP6]
MSNSSPASTLLGKIATYTEILSRDPKSTVFVPLAEAYRNMGLLDDALDIAVKGTHSQPFYPPGFLALGRIQVEKRQFADALQSFEKVLTTEPENSEALKELARTCRLMDRDDLALQWLQKAAALVAEDDEIKIQLEELTGEGGDTNPSRIEPSPMATPVSTESATDRGVAPITTATIAEIYIRQGFLRRALKVYRDLLRADDHNDAVRQKLVALKQSILEAEGGSGGSNDLETPFDAAVASAKPAEPPKSLPAPVVENSPPPDMLVILNGWLESIHRRKMDVR